MVNNYKAQLVNAIHKQVSAEKKSCYFYQDLINVLALKCKVVLPKHLQKYVNDPQKYKTAPQDIKQITKVEYVEKLLPYYVAQSMKNEMDLLNKKFHPSKSESEVLKGALKKMFDVFLKDNLSPVQFEMTVKESSKIIQDFVIKNRMTKYWDEDKTSKFYSSKYSKSGLDGVKKFAAENNLGTTLQDKLEHNATRFHELLKFDNMDQFTSKITQTLIQGLHKDLADDFRTITMTPEYVCDGNEIFFRGISLPKNINITEWLSENHIAKGGMSYSSWLDYFVHNRFSGVSGGFEDDFYNGATSATNDIEIALGYARGDSQNGLENYILEVRPKGGTVLTNVIAAGQLNKAHCNEIFFDQVSNRDIKIFKIPANLTMHNIKEMKEVHNPYYVKRALDKDYCFVDFYKNLIDSSASTKDSIYSKEIFASYERSERSEKGYGIDYFETKDCSLVSREDVMAVREYKDSDLYLHSAEISGDYAS